MGGIIAILLPAERLKTIRTSEQAEDQEDQAQALAEEAQETVEQAESDVQAVEDSIQNEVLADFTGKMDLAGSWQD